MSSINGTQKETKIPIMEIFGPTIQGEGLMAGTVTHFLRTGGCGLRCNWCDTLFAVEPAQIKAGRKMMTIMEIITAIKERPYAPWLTLTGGDPCLHKGLGDIIHHINLSGTQVAVETQGQLFPEWLKKCDVVTLSPKPPSSGNVVDFDAMIHHMIKMFGKRPQHRKTRLCVKVVVFDMADYEYAIEVYKALPYSMYDSFYFTAGTKQFDDAPESIEDFSIRAMDRVFNVIDAQRKLAERMLTHSRLFDEKVHVGCQQHVLLWPEKEQGV